MVTNYLHNGDKKLIPRILKELDDYPELKATNDKRKRQIKQVYRGIGGVGHSSSSKVIKDMLAKDKKQKVVSASRYDDSAKNFAMHKGHLWGDRNNEWGLLVTYKTSPNSIILDTAIFGGIFGEGEVLIDASKAKVDTYEVV